MRTDGPLSALIAEGHVLIQDSGTSSVLRCSARIRFTTASKFHLLLASFD